MNRVIRSLDNTHPAVMAYLVRLRARWLDSLPVEGRAALNEMNQKRVESLFAEWLRATADQN